MVRSDDDSFYLYGVGEQPDALTLGSLVLEKYWQPLIARHYTHSPLRDEDLSSHAWSSNLTNCIFHGRTRLSPGVGVSGLDIVDLRLAWHKDHERVITARSGKRLTLKDPEAFLTDHVLSTPKAQAALRLWLSSARSDYVTSLRWARRPKIWLLTGLYILEGTRSIVRKKSSSDIDLGLSSNLVGALSGVPVGGSVSLGVGDNWEMTMEMEESHVWAAQYRLLDARYLPLRKKQSGLNREEEAGLMMLSLYKDILSMRDRRTVPASAVARGRADEDVGEDVEVGLVPEESDDMPYSLVEQTPDPEKEGEEEEEEAFEEYDKRLEEAIRMFEAAPRGLLEGY